MTRTAAPPSILPTAPPPPPPPERRLAYALLALAVLCLIAAVLAEVLQSRGP